MRIRALPSPSQRGCGINFPPPSKPAAVARTPSGTWFGSGRINSRAPPRGDGRAGRRGLFNSRHPTPPTPPAHPLIGRRVRDIRPCLFADRFSFSFGAARLRRYPASLFSKKRRPGRGGTEESSISPNLCNFLERRYPTASHSATRRPIRVGIY